MSDENVRGWFVIVHPITGNINHKIEDTGTFEAANRIMEALRKGFSVRHKANPKYDTPPIPQEQYKKTKPVTSVVQIMKALATLESKGIKLALSNIRTRDTTEYTQSVQIKCM